MQSELHVQCSPYLQGDAVQECKDRAMRTELDGTLHTLTLTPTLAPNPFPNPTPTPTPDPSPNPSLTPTLTPTLTLTQGCAS